MMCHTVEAAGVKVFGVVCEREREEKNEVGFSILHDFPTRKSIF